MSVSVRVPIDDAIQWDPWLTTELGVQAERLGLGYDGGEEDDGFEVFDFDGDARTVEQAVVTALATHAVFRPVKRVRRTVTVTGVQGKWLTPLTPKDSAYAKALHRVAEELSEQPDLAAWWAGTGLTKLRFHEATADQQVGPSPVKFSRHQEEDEVMLMHYTDLSMVNEDPKPSKADAEALAREHLWEILRGVADHLDRPLP